MRPVVPHRSVLGTAIVPERDRVQLPAEATLKQWVFHVLVEIAQDSIAFVDGNAEDARRKATIDKERPLPRDRMRTNHGMLGAGIDRLVELAIVVKQPPIHVLAVMDGVQSL